MLKRKKNLLNYSYFFIDKSYIKNLLYFYKISKIKKFLKFIKIKIKRIININNLCLFKKIILTYKLKKLTLQLSGFIIKILKKFTNKLQIKVLKNYGSLKAIVILNLFYVKGLNFSISNEKLKNKFKFL